MPLFSQFYQRNVHNGHRTWNVEPSTSTIPPSPRERRKLAREKRKREGEGRGEREGGEEKGEERGREGRGERKREGEKKRGREREREGMCRCTHILIEERRERGWLSMRGVVAPPPPSNDQAELLLG